MKPWYALSPAEIEKDLATDFHDGLSEAEAKKRLLERGPNELPEGKADGILLIFLRQFASPLIYILILAAAVVFYLGEHVDAVLIAIVLLFNAVIGSIQEGRAQDTLAALRKFSETSATVVREGRELIIPDREVVPGDIIVLHEGEKVPADARLISSRMLRADEAALTGESVPIHKHATDLAREDMPLTGQVNMVFKGTPIVSGHGRAAVVETGRNSVLGRISATIAEVKSEIPLQRDIRLLSRMLILAVGLISAVIFSVGLYLGNPLEEMFSTTISLAISIIPEGLPVVLTLILAGGVWRMAKRHALVKKLQAVEALGQAKIIAVDKTGTLTRNEMVIREVVVDGKTFKVGGTGYEPKGEFLLGEYAIDPPNHPELLLAGKISALCAEARVVYSEEDKLWRVAGDPTEAALVVFGKKMGFHREDLEREWPLLSEVPFDYRLKFHLTSHKEENKQLVSVTGAPEALLALSDRMHRNGRAEALGAKMRAEWEERFQQMSARGLRVVAFGYEELPLHADAGRVEKLVFGGLVGIEDSLRPEVPEAMAKAIAAGIRIVMITGDSRPTAVAIAKEAGIWHEGDAVVTDTDLEKLSEAELDAKLAGATVFARITPDHKMKIIQAYKRRGEIVAMTGDGVNDAPPLVAADLGVAMGKIGTEVAKEAADIILLDDNFGSIVSAVEEGRSMYKTIQKVLLFLFSTSLGEVFIIFGSILLGWPLPLLAAQILWLNLVTDSFVAFALALDHKEKNILEEKFSHPNRYLVNGAMIQRMIVMCVPMALGTLFLFSLFAPFGAAADMTRAWTYTLTAAAMYQWLNGWNCRSDRESVFRTNPFSNKFLILGTLVAAGLHVFAMYNPFLQSVLRLTPLSLWEWVLIGAVSFSIILADEAWKFFYRRRLARKEGIAAPLRKARAA